MKASKQKQLIKRIDGIRRDENVLAYVALATHVLIWAVMLVLTW